MKASWLRAVLALMLVATLAGKPLQGSANFDRDALTGNILRVLAENRLATLVAKPLPREVLAAAAQFEVPGCDGPIEVIPVFINLQEAPLFDTVIRPGYTRQFAYLDRTWTSADRLQLRLTWLKHKALGMLGLGRFVAIATALLVVSPPGCQAAAAIDWSPVWTRATTAASSPAG